ncbi:P-loop containing nucleoside triphosphate hydrolase protein [Anaeromyces robustus]|uniref:p-loop containing nucleoside triphosphate hydrolase protein n=1 Tax=Anaeromyces robustus TaxID=1754192 RepID=A0A1Y1XG23_9FUNG|nr:P-loop containing nucleoside triphosphate hydrolase protein [Anaeromyces robustus]|eukprot:ORX84705.1 P-loop containing nucleoside triphosphate hydrolase protein [Anaeromyces robustus]
MDFEDKYSNHLKKYTKKGISRLFEMAEEKKILLYLSSFFSIVAAACSLVPYISIYFILQILLKNYVFYSNNTRKGNDIENDSQIMIKWGIVAAVSFAFVVFFEGVSLGFSHIAAYTVLYNIRVRIAEHIGFLPLGYLSSTTTGAISKTLEQNVEKIELFIAHTIPDIVKVLATVVFSIIIFLRFNIILTIVCIVVFILAILCQFAGMFSKRSMELQKEYFDICDKISGSVVQFIYGIQIIKIFGKDVFSFHRLADDIHKCRENAINCCNVYRTGMCYFVALLESFAIFIIPVGALLLSRNEKDLSLALDYIFFIIMGPSLSTPLRNLLMMVINLEAIKEGNYRIDAILNEDIIPQPENPKIPTKYNVTFKNVTFNYKETKKSRNSDRDALSNISFEAENGKITALVGPSGSGKSTIGNLIPRFWDVEKGEICIGGINVKEIKYNDLMNIISFVFQDSFLFNDTVFNNISIGRPNATKEDVIAAAKAAQCHEFIENLPQKYETIIGSPDDKDGVLLSGGEQQRICIARAILKKSPILVLDEATAFSDPENEYNIQLALKELIKDKTVIVIAHNLNTVKSADNILVINEGKIIEQGKHDQLLNNQGFYSSMWNAYISSSKWFISNKKTSSEMISPLKPNNSHNENVTSSVKKASSSPISEQTEDKYKALRTKSTPKKNTIISEHLGILYNITCGHPKNLYKAILFTFIANLINIFPFGLTVVVIQTVFDAFDGSEKPINFTKIWIISVVLLMYIFVMYLAQVPAFNHCYYEAHKTSSLGRIKLAEHVRRLPLGTIYSKDPGEIVNILINDFLSIETCSSHYLPQLVGASVMPIVAFVALFFIDWRLDLATFLPLPVGVLILLLSTSYQNRLSSRQLNSRVEAGNSFHEYMRGIRCIKAYNLIGKKFDRLEKSFRKLMIDSIKLEFGLGPVVSLSTTIAHSGIFFLLLVGAYLLKNGDIKVSTFVTFVIIGSRVYDPLVRALVSVAEVRYFNVAGKRIQKFLDLQIQEGTTDVHYEPNKDIIFEHVDFKYLDDSKSTKKSTDEYILKDINIVMKQGSLTALVGPSGSGKTTILKLISKFYDANNGKITFAGEDISKIDPELYMKNISIVFQDVYLFQDTIMNNIKFGREDASQDEIIEAAKKACAHEFIMKLQNGYDTIVGEGGCTLSGGEKQRISIARAILKNSPVVLLDEATSSLDPENEVEVQKAISELIAGRTVIVISHHLKTIKTADNIVVLNNGMISEQGTHDELIKNNGIYKHLWEIQEKYQGWSMK